jgi:hypothetical protein
MENLPPEILIKIFIKLNEFSSIIALSKVCKRFREIIIHHIRCTAISFGSKESRDEIQKFSKEIFNLKIAAIKLEISNDENLDDKMEFCRIHSNKITHLTINEITFLNPIMESYFEELQSLCLRKSDLSSSTDLAGFILSCPKLKHLTFSSCDGLEVAALNSIGRDLHLTTIQKLELFPSYSYYDVSENDARDWRIENLKEFSVRSSFNEIVVMKRNFVRKMLGRLVCVDLVKLELNAEINYGDNNFVPFLISHFPNLQILKLGRGVTPVCNQDFIRICNGFKCLTSLEFHFINRSDEELQMRALQRNNNISELTLGLTKELSSENLKFIASRLTNLKKVSVILYNHARNTQDYLIQLTKIFPNLVQFQKTGQKCSQAMLSNLG